MPRKTLGRKKGIERSIPRHSIGTKRASEDNEDSPTATERARFLCVSRSKFVWFGQKCFDMMLSSCEKTCLIGFKRSSSGEYVMLDQRAQFAHSVAIAGYLAIFLHKIFGTVHLVLYEELRIQSFICINLSTIQIASVLCGVGIVMRPKETIDLLNSWPNVGLDVRQQMSSPTKFDPLHDVSTCCKVISIFFAAQGITAGAALLSLVISDLPICLFPMAERFGWIPPDMYSRFVWQSMFTPLEWLTYFPFLAMAGFASAVLIMGTGAVNVYLGPLRMVQLKMMECRQRLERMYVELELFNRIFQVWIRLFFPSFLLAYACGMIICLFITIRYTELPFFVYILFPYVTLTLIVLLFWQSYDMIHAIRGSEGILGSLLEQQAPYLLGMSRRQRLKLMKRAKAMRPVGFPVADSEFSLSVPVNTWEEVLNQVVFLLSL